MQNNKQLPNKLSELLRIALEDLKKAEQSPEYIINMDNWSLYNGSTKKCEVCLAGAVVAIELDLKGFMNPNHIHDPALKQKIEILNQLRVSYTGPHLHQDISSYYGIDWDILDRLDLNFTTGSRFDQQEYYSISQDLESNQIWHLFQQTKVEYIKQIEELLSLETPIVPGSNEE